MARSSGMCLARVLAPAPTMPTRTAAMALRRPPPRCSRRAADVRPMRGCCSGDGAAVGAQARHGDGERGIAGRVTDGRTGATDRPRRRSRPIGVRPHAPAGTHDAAQLRCRRSRRCGDGRRAGGGDATRCGRTRDTRAPLAARRRRATEMAGTDVDIDALLEAPYRKQPEVRGACGAAAQRRGASVTCAHVPPECARARGLPARSQPQPQPRADGTKAVAATAAAGVTAAGAATAAAAPAVEAKSIRADGRPPRSRSPSPQQRSARRSHERPRSRERDRRRGSRSRSPRAQSRGRSRERAPASAAASNGTPRAPDGSAASVDPLQAELERDERLRRTVFCMQLPPRVTMKDMEQFFAERAGRVRDVQIMSDRRRKGSAAGVAYVEFFELESVPRAIALSGQRLNGVPVIVQPTQAERNKLAAQQQRDILVQPTGPTRVLVSELHPSLGETELRSIVEPFGTLEGVEIERDAAGVSLGLAHVGFRQAAFARKACEALNNISLAGKRLRVVLEADAASLPASLPPSLKPGPAIPAATAAAGAALPVPRTTTPPPLASPAAPRPTRCLVLRNMAAASQAPQTMAGGDGDDGLPEWAADLREDVIAECSRFGDVFLVRVSLDAPQPLVYVKFASSDVAMAAHAVLHGRWYSRRQIVCDFITEEELYRHVPSARGAEAPLLLVGGE